MDNGEGKGGKGKGRKKIMGQKEEKQTGGTERGTRNREQGTGNKDDMG
jgi:hypothetical protein